jgi:hypothetical protein
MSKWPTFSSIVAELLHFAKTAIRLLRVQKATETANGQVVSAAYDVDPCAAARCNSLTPIADLTGESGHVRTGWRP